MFVKSISAIVLFVHLGGISFCCVRCCADESTRAEARSPSTIRSDFRKLAKAIATADTKKSKTRNLVAMCRLFVEIGEHPKLEKSVTLQGLSIRIRTQLLSQEKRIAAEMRRRGIEQPAKMAAEETARRRARAGNGFATQAYNNYRLGNASYASSRTSDSSGTSSGEASAKTAAGDTGSATGQAGPGGLPDYGWQLVNLIRQTIRPDYWAVAGGPGKAIYYGPSRALVIHGSWRVQEDVAELLGALRGEN